MYVLMPANPVCDIVDVIRDQFHTDICPFRSGKSGEEAVVSDAFLELQLLARFWRAMSTIKMLCLELPAVHKGRIPT